MSEIWKRRRTLFTIAMLALAAGVGSSQSPARSRLVAIFVVDGLRPDSINPADTPTIARLRAEGAGT